MTRKRSLRDFIRTLKDGDTLIVKKVTEGCHCASKKSPDYNTIKRNHFPTCKLGKIKQVAQVFLVGNRPEQTLYIGEEDAHTAK